MKKNFLLSLLSILSLSAFSQISVENPEVLVRIDITMNDDTNDDSIERIPNYPWWLFRYRNVLTEYYPGGVNISCTGFGLFMCFPFFQDIANFSIRGLAIETLEATYKDMIETSRALAANGEFYGSVTRKLAYQDQERGNLLSYILFQINWDNEPYNPLNGKAKIIISKTTNFGM